MSNSPPLSAPFRTKKKEFWIRKLGIAFRYSCNDNVDCVGNLSSPQGHNVNVMRHFNNIERRKRINGFRFYNKPNKNNVSFDSLLLFYINK